MDEVRRIQKVGYSTLAVSIPKDLVKEHHLKQGDSLLFREDVDGTIRLLPGAGEKRISKAAIKADQIEDLDLLSRLIIGSYALGYDVIEVAGKGKLSRATVERSRETIKRLRGLEVVEVEDDRVVAHSFMDPTKFPVDSLIRRLQILVSRGLDGVIDAFDLRRTSKLEELRRSQEEVDEVYWLVIRQLLIALSRREMAAEIGIESPLHASGDRMMAKALEEIGTIVLNMSKELLRLKERKVKMDKDVVSRLTALATATRKAFDTTAESLRTPDIRLIEESVGSINRALDLEKQTSREMFGSGQYDYSRILVSYLGQLLGYCDVITEIAFHRLLRKSSHVATIQHVE
ncbi:MAG TPA: phosphate uptake regulator PhoU [Nitrososphaerales archaeon]|nr:phosphate uptake regulator PhoU [Nitrososphaerales archaeon]